jgi:hypothetical protein
LLGNQEFHWRIFQPGEEICKPKGEAVAIKISKGTDAERQTFAEQTGKLIAYERGIPDWRNTQAPDWCK